MVNFGNDWDEILKDEFDKEYYRELRKKLVTEYRTREIFPDMFDIFRAQQLTSYRDTKVLILGQDPYHDVGQAHGLAFSVKPGVRTPPSLLNIFKEIRDEYGYEIPNNGFLESWAKQGILLLNTSLTVRAHMANSHKGLGWEIYTDDVIKVLNDREDPVIFVLWGANARAKKAFIDTSRHYVLESPHPSPLSARRGFFGNGHFRKVNEILEKLGKEPIDWRIDNI